MRRKVMLKSIRMSKSFVTICVLILLPLLVPCEVFAKGKTTLVSVSSGGVQGNDRSSTPSISSDGRYVAFSSVADNLVVGDTNNMVDIFVHDRITEETMRVSVSSLGVEGNLESASPSISSDGRYVAFMSYANNLVIGDTNEVEDIFVHDRKTGKTTRVNVSSTGEQVISSASFVPSISSDGRYVAFMSYANNLVIGDTNSSYDIFVHDRLFGLTGQYLPLLLLDY